MDDKNNAEKITPVAQLWPSKRIALADDGSILYKPASVLYHLTLLPGDKTRFKLEIVSDDGCEYFGKNEYFVLEVEKGKVNIAKTISHADAPAAAKSGEGYISVKTSPVADMPSPHRINNQTVLHPQHGTSHSLNTWISGHCQSLAKMSTRHRESHLNHAAKLTEHVDAALRDPHTRAEHVYVAKNTGVETVGHLKFSNVMNDKITASLRLGG